MSEPKDIGYAIHPAITHGRLPALPAICAQEGCECPAVWIVDPEWEGGALVVCEQHLVDALRAAQPAFVESIEHRQRLYDQWAEIHEASRRPK
jgi:hypothetical protein